MKGCRKLRVGEVIREGDIFFDAYNKDKKEKADFWAGDTIDNMHQDHYRPIPKKARKVKKLNARHEIYNIIGKRYFQKEYTNRHEFYFDCSVDIARFIRRNYRRKDNV